MDDYILIKEQLLFKCTAIVQEKISTSSGILKRLNESLFNETKSSAGDKFETSRAMLQADIDRNQTIIIKNQTQLQKLKSISMKPDTTIKEGSLVTTTGINYFVTIPLGKIELQEKFYAISISSPIGKKLIGKKANDTIEFNQKSFKILHVC